MAVERHLQRVAQATQIVIDLAMATAAVYDL